MNLSLQKKITRSMLYYFGIGVPIFIGFTCIIAFWKRYKYFRTPMRPFFYLLLFFFISDSFGWMVRNGGYKLNWLYNISILVQIPVYISIYKNLITKQEKKQIFNYSSVFFSQYSVWSVYALLISLTDLIHLIFSWGVFY